MLKQCCCGCTLRKGTHLIAIFNIIYGMGSILIYIQQFVYGALTKFSTEEMVSLYINLTFSVINSMAGFLLIYSTMKTNITTFRIWMIYYSVAIIVALIYCSVLGCIKFQHGLVNTGILIIIAGGITIGLCCYFFTVVYSYYITLIAVAVSETAQSSSNS